MQSLKDIRTFVPNLYIPDYGAKLTSAIYIRGVGARSSGQTVGLYVDHAPYPDKSTFDFELPDIRCQLRTWATRSASSGEDQLKEGCTLGRPSSYRRLQARTSCKKDGG